MSKCDFYVDVSMLEEGFLLLCCLFVFLCLLCMASLKLGIMISVLVKFKRKKGAYLTNLSFKLIIIPYSTS